MSFSCEQHEADEKLLSVTACCEPPKAKISNQKPVSCTGRKWGEEMGQTQHGRLEITPLLRLKSSLLLIRVFKGALRLQVFLGPNSGMLLTGLVNHLTSRQLSV